MVNDLRKLCGVDALCPTDNVSELTARTNDEGFDTIFNEYLKTSHFCSRDAIFILSVGGGNKEKNVSLALINAIDLAKEYGAKVLGIVGRKDGYAATQGDNVVVVPPLYAERVTPHSEAFQAVVWHCLVSNPVLQVKATKW
jgi:D-sedoheptulose 7-phosphate isomerase